MKQIKARFGDSIAFVLTVFLTFPLLAQVSSTERQALIDFYNATNGNNWKNTIEGTQPWLINDSNSLVSDWYGVTVLNGKVTKLSFFKNNLTGTLPNSIGDLSSINQLVLSGNNIGGELPTSLGQMTGLQSLHLSGNEFSGAIPITALLNAPGLSRLYFDGNNFSGTIPPQLGQLTNLTFINMGYNQLTGTIPVELAQLSKLGSLYLSNNKLTGSIPQELGQLTSLQKLSLASNELTGGIPESLALLTNLGSLSLSGNQLTGIIPPQLGQLSKLYALSLNNNNLTGTLPSELGQLVNMKRLYVSDNQISGSIPSSFGQMSKLENLQLGKNQLTGSIPSEMSLLSNMVRIGLSSNKISGDIPSELGQLTKIEHIHFHNNDLTGSIPISFKQLVNLKALYLYNNNLSGKIPPEMSTLPKLSNFGISGNQFIFSDFESEFTAYQANLSSFTYNNQKNADVEETLSASIGGSVTLTSNVFTNSSNTYQWYKGTTIIPGATNKEYTIANVSETDAGVYKMLVKNSVVTGLSIYRNDITLLVTQGENTCGVSAAERQALIDFYNSTDGANWTNTQANNRPWLVNDPHSLVCDWAGVTVTNGKVTKLALSNNGLKGTIPASFGNLVHLTFVNFAINQLSGSLPDSIGNLVNAETFTVERNAMTGAIPTSIGSMVALKVLNLGSNQFSGEIPVSLQNLTNLTTLNLFRNTLTGTIPAELGNLSNLEYLNLFSNQLAGVIPPSIGNLSKLKKLMLYINRLEGPMPSELGNLVNLEELHFERNTITGSIPISFGNLSSLQYLNLGNNALSGSIPKELGNLSNLTKLYLFWNKLEGEIPLELGNLTKTEVLSFTRNLLTGAIPASIGQLPGLTNLGLGINKFSGSIPSGLSSLASSDILNSLSFESNSFVFSDFEANFTTYKSNLTTFTYLTQGKVDQTETLSVAANGSITLSSTALTSTNNSYQWYKDGAAITGATNKDLVISNATDADAGVYHFTATNSVITDLTLTRNPITLSIGAGDTCGVSAAERQALVDLYNSTDGANWTNTIANNKPWLVNDPTSKVCDWFGVTVSEGKVKGISLPENNLTGTLPNSLGSLIELRTIYLHSNNLSGNIPSSFGNLSFLRFLFLHSNNLEGNIPSELGMLSNLIDLLLFSNQLTGVIPPELGNLSKLRDLNLSRNKLSGSIPSEFGQFSNTLFRINISYNYNLKGKIPSSISNLTGLTIFRMNTNKFVFSDFEADYNNYINKLGTFQVAPQAKVDQEETLSVAANGSITLSSTALTSTNNSYQWYKDGVAITGATSKDLVISNATDADAGIYHFTATNSIVTGLTLTRNPITLSIGAGDVCGVSAAERQALIDLYNSTDGANWTNITVNNEPWLITDSASKVCDWYGVTVTEGKVTELKLDNNNLVGTIPNSISDLSNLKSLSLNKNTISGSIPNTIGGLVNLTNLSIDNNKLTGTIPVSISGLSKLTNLSLYLNRLSGAIPSELGSLSDLKVLHIGLNQFQGQIPSSLGNLSKLTYLYLSNNKLEGEIPLELGNLINLQTLEISNNNFSGTIPSQISNFANLLHLRFKGNSFVFNSFETEHLAYKSKLTNYIFSPQDKVDQTETLSVAANGSITLSSTALTSTNNSYQWYKGGAAITGATNKDLVISNATDADAGVYHFTATNSVITDLTLTRNPITLEVTTAVNELEVTINTKDLPNSEFDIVSGSTTIPGVISGNADSETLVNLGANTGENKTVLINVKPSQNAGALHLRFIANTSGISNVQVSSGGNWLDFSPDFYRIEGSTIYFMNKKTTPVVPFTINLINGVQYNSSVPLTINVNNSIDLIGATVEIFSPSNANIVVQPSASINGFVLDTTLTEVGSYTFIMKIQNKSFKGHFLVAGSGQTGNGSF